MQILYVMQGVPGSGKSFLGQMLHWHASCVVCSTDDFFYNDEGVYQFNPALLGQYHKKNLDEAKTHMDEGKSVVVDNTNIHAWECREYVKHAVSLNIPVVFIRVESKFESTHGVPLEKIEQMRKQMEILTLETVLASKCPWE